MKLTIVTTKEIVKSQIMIFPTIVIEKESTTTTHIVLAFWHTMYGVSFVR